MLGVSQASVLGPVLFNIFINDLIFSTREDICNFADDNTLYSCDKDPNLVLQKLNEELKVVVKWFSDNGMVANPDRFQAIFLGCKGENYNFELGNKQIVNSSTFKLLGVTLDQDLSFYPHVVTMCIAGLCEN